MYRIVKESLVVLKRELDQSDDARARIAKPLYLMVNVEAYQMEKQQESDPYQRLSQLLHEFSSHSDRYPRFKSLIWSLESHGIVGVPYNALTPDELKETIKLMTSILNLAYWEEVS